MPYGYLVTVVLFGAITALALSPIRRPWSVGKMSFRLTFLINEQPFLVIYWLVTATLLLIAQGDATSTGGGVALGASLLVLLGLVVIVGRALRARSCIDEALRDGLPGWRRRSRAPLRLGRILFAPFHVRRSDVEHIKDVSYGPHGERNLLDVYRPRDGAIRGPTFVHFHGGGFQSGHKDRESRSLIYHLASRGWCCVSANYRLAPEASFPEYLVDAKRVVAWVRSEGASYGADSSTVIASGSSAGGHLAAMLALTSGMTQFQPGFEESDTSISGSIPMYGYFGPLESSHSLPSSPMSYDPSNAAPCFVIHGRLDSYVVVEGARALVEKLRSGSPHPVLYAELPGAQHTFDLFHSVRFDLVVDGIEQFGNWLADRDRAEETTRPPEPA